MVIRSALSLSSARLNTTPPSIPRAVPVTFTSYAVISPLCSGKIPPETLRTLQYAGIDLHRWLHGFDSVQESVRSSVEIIRLHPLVPKGVPVHGLIIDPNTGGCWACARGVCWVV